LQRFPLPHPPQTSLPTQTLDFLFSLGSLVKDRPTPLFSSPLTSIRQNSSSPRLLLRRICSHLPMEALLFFSYHRQFDHDQNFFLSNIPPAQANAHIFFALQGLQRNPPLSGQSRGYLLVLFPRFPWVQIILSSLSLFPQNPSVVS